MNYQLPVEELESRGTCTAGAMEGAASVLGSVASRPLTVNGTQEFEVSWNSNDDPADPNNWPLWYKSLTITAVTLGATFISLPSTL